MKGHKGSKIKGHHDLFERMARWCAASERSPFEVSKKLTSLGLAEDEARTLIEGLRDDGYLDELRFASAYAGGKFRINKWGRLKIKAGLRNHRIPDALIREALSSIGESDYERALGLLAQKKADSLTTIDKRKKHQAVYLFLSQKGFESEKISHALNLLLGETGNYEFRT